MKAKIENLFTKRNFLDLKLNNVYFKIFHSSELTQQFHCSFTIY
jgi:hypothetical protein